VRDSTPPALGDKPRIVTSVVMLSPPGWEDEDAIELKPEEALQLLTELAKVMGYSVSKV